MPSSLTQTDQLPSSWRFAPTIGLVLPDGLEGCPGFPVLWAGSVQNGTRICRLGVRISPQGRRLLRRGRRFRVRFFHPDQDGGVSTWHCRYLGQTSRFNLVILRGEILEEDACDSEKR